MKIDLPKDVRFILERLGAGGFAAFAVGGCVRDSLMGKVPKDWDIATSAQPCEVKAAFPHTVDTGIQHGTVTVVRKRQNYEVTSFRVDGEYLDGRRPEAVTFTTDLEQDLSRRDFTMNAIAYNPAVGLKDLFGGYADIRLKKIRCVGNARERFTEDALRMMRAVRFSAQLGFDIEEETYSAIAPLSERLAMVSIERIRDELTKILTSMNPAALVMLDDTGLWEHVPLSCDIASAVPRLEKCPKEPPMLYALLGADAETMRRLHFDNRTVNETSLYLRYLDAEIIDEAYEIKKLLNKMSPREFRNLLVLKNIADGADYSRIRGTCDEILRLGECFTLKELAVDGEALIGIGIPAGKAMGRIFAQLLDMVMREPSLNEKNTLLQKAKNL